MVPSKKIGKTDQIFESKMEINNQLNFCLSLGCCPVLTQTNYSSSRVLQMSVVACEHTNRLLRLSLKSDKLPYSCRVRKGAWSYYWVHHICEAGLSKTETSSSQGTRKRSEKSSKKREAETALQKIRL